MVMYWYYDYSDDHHVWRAGSTAMSLLQGQAKEQRKEKILSIKARIASETINA